MKLTDREKLLLKLLAVCAFLAIIYFIIIKPELYYKDKLEKKAEEYSEVIEAVKLKVNIENPVYKEYKILNAKTQDLLRKYYPSIIQEKIILMLDSKIETSGLKVSTISFAEPSLAALNKTENKNKNQANESKKSEAGKEDLTSFESITASLTFEGSYAQLYSFISLIELENRSIELNNLKITSKAEDKISGDMQITIYAISKPFEQDQDYMAWNITGEYGKYNPFGFAQGLGITAAPTSLPEVSEVALDSKDFFISLRPITSDLPSITIGKFDDADRDTYVYADNIGYENIELQILQEGDKFYYGYRTENYSYPSSYGKELIEFTPVGDELKVVVISTPRNKEKDINGAKLSVLNKTQRPIKIYVRNDDTSLPRLKLDKLRDNVTVVQE